MLRDGTRSDPHGFATRLREAILEMRVGVDTIRRALTATEQEIAAERKMQADADRRGKLAAMVPDPETVQLAERYAARHAERAGVLERKLAVQRDELAMAERELAEMTSQAKQATAGQPTESIAAAWRDLEAAGATRPEAPALADAELDRRRREEAIEAQLAYLKKKLGRQ